MPLRNAQLDEHRSRIGMVMPDVGDTKLYQKVVGGIKIGYSGHVPRAQSHAFTSSMGGVAAAEESGYNYTAQRGHVAWQEKSVGRGEKMATLRAAHSIPGYHGHRRGAEEVGGTSFWHNDPSAAARARPKRESPKPRRETRVDASTDYEKEARAAAAAAHAAGCRMAWASTSAGLPPQPVAQEMPTPDSERKAYQAAVDRGRRNAVVETMPAAPQPTHAAGKPTRKAWPAPAAAAPAVEETAPPASHRSSARGPTSYRLASEVHGRPGTDPGTAPPPLQQNEYVQAPRMRDPDEVALKPRMVKRIVSGLQGKAEDWVPPAGLYIENSKHGLGQNLWEACGKQTRQLGPRTAEPKGPMFELPQHRDPEDAALKPKHVRQITRNLTGPVDTWKPPAGLYVENSKAFGPHHNMWEVLRRVKAGGTLAIPEKAVAPAPAAAPAGEVRA